MKIGVVSLGCDKNRIDSENMLAYLQDDGYELTQEDQFGMRKKRGNKRGQMKLTIT